MELMILLGIAIFVLAYRMNTGDNVYKFFADSVSSVYNTYAPYSYKEVKQKTKELGYEYTPRQYATQVGMMGGAAAILTFLYFYSIPTTIIYTIIAICFVPYLAYLRCKRIYSEFIFEQIQTYTTNVIMEFNTTQSFVKSLEGVRDSGILEDPLLSDVKVVTRYSKQYFDANFIPQSIKLDKIKINIEFEIVE